MLAVLLLIGGLAGWGYPFKAIGVAVAPLLGTLALWGYPIPAAFGGAAAIGYALADALKRRLGRSGPDPVG